MTKSKAHAYNQEKNSMAIKLGAHVTGSFKVKSKSKVADKTTLENIMGNMEKNLAIVFKE